jgi:hypothetical protein
MTRLQQFSVLTWQMISSVRFTSSPAGSATIVGLMNYIAWITPTSFTRPIDPP